MDPNRFADDFVRNWLSQPEVLRRKAAITEDEKRRVRSLISSTKAQRSEKLLDELAALLAPAWERSLRKGARV